MSNTQKKVNHLFILLILLISIPSFAADRYWVGDNSNKNWNAIANWSATSGGTGGASVPGVNDSVYFNSGGIGQLILDVNIAVLKLTMESSYADTIKQNGKIIILTNGGMVLKGGTFLGSTANISVTGPFILAGTQFISTSAIIAVSGNYSFTSGSFAHNNGTVQFYGPPGTSTRTISGSTDFYNLQLAASSGATYTFDISSVFNVSHMLTENGSATIKINTGTINVQGDITMAGTAFNPVATGTIHINGSGNQTVYGATGPNSLNQGGFCNVKIDKTGGVLYLRNIINVAGTWEHIAGAVDDTTYDAEMSFNTGGTNIIKGTQIFNKMWIGTYSGSNNFKVFAGDTLTVGWVHTGVSGSITYDGYINVTGDFWLGSTGTSGGGTGTITFNGTGNQLLTGQTLSATQGILCNIKIDKPSGTLKLKNIISVRGNWNYIRGDVDAKTDSSNVFFVAGTRTVSGKHKLNYLTFYSTTSSTNTIPVADTITVEGLLRITGSGSIDINGGTLNAKGGILSENTAINGGGGTATINVCGNGYQELIGNSTVSAGKLCNISINKSGTLRLKKTISVAGNWIRNSGTLDALTDTSCVVFCGGTRNIIGKDKFHIVCFYAVGNCNNVIPETDTVTVLNNIVFAGTNVLNIYTGTIKAKGDIYLSNTSTGNGGDGLIHICGEGIQTLIGNNTIGLGRLPNVKIDKTGGVLIVKNKPSISGNWTHLNGTLNLTTHTPTIVFAGTGTVTTNGKHLHNVSFYSSTTTIPANDPLNVDGELRFENAYGITINTGIINARGNISVPNLIQVAGGGTGTINICGTSNQTFSGNTTPLRGPVCNVTIDKPSGTLSLANAISLAPTSTWRYIQGTVDPGTSMVAVISGATINCGTPSASMQFYDFRIQGGSVTTNLSGVLNVKRNLYVEQARSLTTNGNDVTIGGDFYSVGLFHGGTSTVTLNGSGRQVLTIAATWFHNLKIDKPSGKVYLDYYSLLIGNNLALDKGVMVCVGNAQLKFGNNATLTGGSNQSYVVGPVWKIGDDAFTYPLGDTTLADTSAYHPFSMTAPTGATSSFTARYFPKNVLTDYPTFTSYASTLKPVSTCEYWSLTRNVGTSTVTPTLGWNANTCNINALADARVGSWNGTQWTDLGNNSTTGNQAAGTIKANTAGPNTANQYYVLAELMPTPIANQRYWVGNGTNKSWNNTANWAAVSGGPGGNPVPTANDTVIFDGGGKGESDFDVNVSIAKLLVKSTYNTNAIVQGTYNLTVGTAGMTLNGGSFTGGSGTITNNGSLILGGSNFTSTSANFTIYGSFTKTGGSFTHNNGRVILKIGTSISGSTNFYSLELNPTGDAVYTLNSSDVLNVAGELKYAGAPAIVINSGSIHAKGDVTLANTRTDNVGNYTLVLDGDGDQTINGADIKWRCVLNNVVITKTAGTVILKDFISVLGNWTNTNGTATNRSNPSTVVFNGGSKTISGNTTFRNLSFYSDATTDGIYTIPSGNALTVEGEFRIEGNKPFYLNGNVNAQGNIAAFYGSTSITDGGTGTITINGTGNQLFSGYDAPKGSRLCNIVIDKVSGTLTLDGYLTPEHNWTHVKGAMDPGTSTIYFTNTGGNKIVSGKNKFNDVVFYGELYNNDTTTVVDTMSVAGELKYALREMTINGGTIAAKGNITIESDQDVNPGNYTLWITGTNNQLLKGTATQQARAALNNVVINKTGGTLSLKDKISIKGNWIYQQGNLDAKTNSSTLILRDANRIFSGNHILYNLTLLGYDVNDPSTSEIPEHDTITVEGEFKIDGGNGAYLNTGTINATGSIRSSSVATAKTGGTATINICGTDDQSFSGQYNGAGRFCNIKINKPSGTLNLSGNITVGESNWNYVKGIVNPGTSRVVFWGNGTVNTVNGASSMEFYHFEVQNGSVTMLSPIIARKDFKTSSFTTLTTNSHDIQVGGYFQNGGVFNLGTTTITFNGTGRQDAYTSTNTNYHKIVINKPSGNVFVDGVFSINNNLTLIKGALVPRSSSTGHYVKLLDNGTVTGGSNESFVMTGVMKVGDDAFTFPLGDTTLADSSKYHPFSMPAPVSPATYTVRYYPRDPLTDHPTYTIIQSPLKSISTCEYYYVEGGPALTPTLGWNSNNCNVTALSDIRVAQWNGTQWTNLGNSSTTGNLSKGSVTASSASIGSYDKYFVIGNTTLIPNGTLTVDTRGLDTISLPDSLRYTISGSGLSGTHAAGGIVNFVPVLPATGQLSTITLSFHYVISGQSINIAFDYTHLGVVVNPRIVPTGPQNPSCNLANCLALDEGIKVQDCFLIDCFPRASPSYAILKKKLDAGYYQVKNRMLYFKYVEEYTSGTLNFNIYDQSNSLQACSSMIAKKYGNNLFGIDLNNACAAQNLTPGYYYLEVINEKSEKFLLKFKF